MSELLMFLAVIIFNAGGIFYLTKNHFPHVNQKIDRLDSRLRSVERSVARIEGALRLPGDLTEH